jgi:hypothetical protein
MTKKIEIELSDSAYEKLLAIQNHIDKDINTAVGASISLVHGYLFPKQIKDLK